MKNVTFESLVQAADARLYGTFRRRTLFFKALSAVLAVQMFFIGAVPFSAVAGGNLPEMSGGYTSGMTLSGNTLTIDSSAGSSFKWDRGFNIGADYTVQFQGIGTAVNRDTSGSRSDIFGALRSDGAVYILNPNGILFGSSARVDVHGLVAAAVGEVNDGPDGMVFSKFGSGSVVNQGSISAGDFAYLVGKSVNNAGSISAGTVALAAFGGTGADSLTIASAPNGAKITFHIPDEGDEIGETGDAGVSGDTGSSGDSGGGVVSAGVITGAANEQAQGGSGATLRGNPDPIPSPDAGGAVNIAMAGDNIVIDTDIGKDDATVKTVDILGNSVKIGKDGGGAVTVKANDGSVKIDAADFINVLKDATITAQKGTTADAANVTMTAGGDITMGGTIKADNDVRIMGGGNVTIGEDAVTVNGAINTSDGDITITGTGGIDVNAALDAAHLIPLPGGAGLIHELGDITLDAGDNAIDIGGNVTAATLTLKSDTSVTAGMTDAATIASVGKTLTIQGENTAIIADNITGPVVQQGGTIQAQPRTGTQNGTLVFGSTVTQSGGRIGGLTTPDGADTPVATDDISIAGALTQTAGQIDAKTLTFGADGNAVAGRINADAIAGGKTVEVQDGGDVNADAIAASTLTVKDGGAVDTKNGTGTLAITGDLVQDGGDIATTAGENVTVSGATAQNGGTLGNATGTVGLDGALTQNGDNAKLYASTLTLKGGATQTKGVVEAATLDMQNADADVTLAQSGNKFGTIGGKAKNATINDSADGLAIDDLEGANLTLTAAGDVTQVAGKTVKATGLADITSTAGNILISAANNELTSFKGTAEGAGKAVKVVNAKALEVQGITAGTTASRGDILVKAAGNSGTISITTAPISGNNVTLSASKGITEGVAVNAKADKYVVTDDGNITVTTPGTVDGNAAYIARNGAINDGEVAASGFVYLNGKNEGTATAKSTNGGTVFVKSGENQYEGAGGGISYDADGNVVFTDADTVAFSGASKNVKIVSTTKGVNIGTVSSSSSALQITEVLDTSATATQMDDLDGTGGSSAGATGLEANKITVNVAGNVTQDSGAAVVAHDDASITATGNIKLAEGGTDNDFQGNVTASGASVTLKDANGIKLGNVTATAGDVVVDTVDGDIMVNAGATVKSDTAAVTLTADDNATVNGTVTAKTDAKVKAANGSVAIAGSVAGDANTVLDGKTGVSGAGSVGKAGSALDVDAASGAIDLTGKVLGTTADFAAQGAVSAANAENDFTGNVTASGASVTLKDANGIKLGNVTATTGNVVVDTVDGDIEVNAGATVKATAGDITLTADDNVKVAGAVDANGTAKLTAAEGMISDADDETVGHAADVAADPFATGTQKTHVKGATVELKAKNAIGAATTPLDIEAGTVTATADDGSVYLFEENDVTVNKISAMENAKIETAAGAITVDGDGITATEGDVLVAANGGGIGQNAAITATAGSISVIATGKIDQKANIKATSGTVDVESTEANIVVDAAATTTAGDNVRYKAATSIENNGAIKTTDDSAAVAFDAASFVGEGAIEAGKLALRADKIGTETTPFKTKVANLAAEAKNGVWIENDGDVTITTVDLAANKVNRISLDSNSEPIGGDAGNVEGLKTTANGPIVLKDGGNINVRSAVTAAGDDGTATLTANAAGTSTGWMQIHANVTAKDVELNADDYIQVAAGKTVEATDGNVAANAAGNINVAGAVKADKGAATLKTTGATKSIKIQGANASVAAKSVTLDASAGKSVQVIGGATVKAAAGNVEATAKEYIAVDGTVEATGGDAKLTTTTEPTLTAAVAGMNAGDPAGVLVLSGSVQGENVTVKSKGSIQTASGTTLKATAGNVELTAEGEKTDTVDQGIRLAGTTTASDSVVANAEKGAFENTGAIKATDGNARIKAKNDVTVGGEVTAGTDVKAQSTEGVFESTAAITATAGDARLLAKQGATVGAAVKAEAGNVRIESTGDAVAVDATVDAKNITLAAGTTVDTAAKVTAGEDLYVAAGGNVTVGDAGAEAGEVMALVSGGAIQAKNVKAATLYAEDANGATIQDIDAAKFVEQSGGDVKLKFNGDAEVAVTAAGNVDVDVVGDAKVGIDAGGYAKAKAGGDLTVDEVKAVDSGALTVTEVLADPAGGANADGTEEVELLADGAAEGDVIGVTAGDKVELTATTGDIKVNKAVEAGTSVNALASNGAFQNTAAITAEDQFVLIQAKNDVTVGGAVTAGGSASAYSSDGAFENTAAITGTEGPVLISAKGDVTVGGEVTAGDFVLATSLDGAFQNTAAITAEDDFVYIQAKNDVKVDAAVTAGTDATALSLDGAFENTAAITATGGKVDIAAKNDVKVGAAVTAGTDVKAQSTAGAFENKAAINAGGKVDIAAKNDVKVGAAVTAGTDVKAQSTDGAIENTATVTAGGDARLLAKNAATIGAAVSAGGNMLLKSSGDKVEVNAEVKGKNVTVNADKAATIGAAATAAEDLYVKAGAGNINATADLEGGQMLVLEAPNGAITVGNVTTKGTFATEDKNGLTINGEQKAKTSIIKTGKDYTSLKVADGSTISVNAGGKVTLKSDGTIIAGDGTGADGKPLAVTEVLADPAGGKKGDGTDETQLAAGAAGGKVSGINGAKGVDLTAAAATGTSVGSSGGDVNVKTTGDYTVRDTSARGTADLDVGGNANVSSVSGGTVDATVGGSFRAGTVSGGNVTIDAGSVSAETVNGGEIQVTSGGAAEFGSVEGGNVNVAAGGNIKTTGNGIKSSDLVLKGGDIDVTLDSQKITSVDGRNVTIVEKAANRDVALGSIAAGGNLNLTAASIGIGNHGQTGFKKAGDGTNLRSGGAMLLDVAGRMGTPSNPLVISVGGRLELDSGNLHGSEVENPGDPNLSPISFFYLLSKGDAATLKDYRGYQGVGKLPGLVIYNGRLYEASPALWLRINRALAFTVETPELKSRQGVFGSPLFIHTDMDVSESASIGSVDYISMATSIAGSGIRTLADRDVYDTLLFTDEDAKNRFESNVADPYGQDKLYTKEFTSGDAED